MNATWIVAANAGRARFFSQANALDRLEEVNDMANPAARLRTSELETDELGQRAASKSRHSVGQPTQPSGYQPYQSPTEHQTELFARDVAAYLRSAQKEGRFGKLYLFASPEFLGELRKYLDSQVQSAVQREINKDYTHSNADELREQVRALREKH